MFTLYVFSVAQFNVLGRHKLNKNRVKLHHANLTIQKKQVPDEENGIPTGQGCKQSQEPGCKVH